MAKKEKVEEHDEMPAWLITFGDMMTLLLTFFVLLVSMAKVDERRKLVVLGSIIGTFGWGTKGYDVMSTKDTRRTVESGAMEDIKDLEPLKPLIWEDTRKDLDFQSNKFVQVLSVNSRLLFAPGSTDLSLEGKDFIKKIMPVLKNVVHPIMLAGHTSLMRDELGEEYKVVKNATKFDPSWKLSLSRTLSVYKYMLDQGMPADMVKLEAFGRFRPHYNQDTPEGRADNRRVDIVLDKRNEKVAKELKTVIKRTVSPPDQYDVDGFTFDLNDTKPN